MISAIMRNIHWMFDAITIVFTRYSYFLLSHYQKKCFMNLFALHDNKCNYAKRPFRTFDAAKKEKTCR